MGIVYKKMSENELSRIIKMRIDQLTEEYTSEGKTVPQDVNLEASLMDFYKRNLAAGTYVSWLAFDGDKIVGTSGMSFAEKPPYFTCPSGKLGILSSMYTDPNYRRLGIATELLDRVVKEAKEYGCGTIYITASDMGVSGSFQCIRSRRWSIRKKAPTQRLEMKNIRKLWHKLRRSWKNTPARAFRSNCRRMCWNAQTPKARPPL